MNSLAVSSKRVQRFEGKLNICEGKQLSVSERAGVTSLVGKKPTSLNTERSYITRLNCSACQSLPITDSNKTISLVGKCNQLAFGVA